MPGHWEGDLLLGRGSQIATVVDRATRFVVLVALPGGRDMHTVTHRLSRQMCTLPEQVRKSLTWDRGMELAGHKTVSAKTGLAVFFADPSSPWQRGTNENTNRLLRQYFPKGRTIANYSQHELDAAETATNLERHSAGRNGTLTQVRHHFAFADSTVREIDVRRITPRAMATRAREPGRPTQ